MARYIDADATVERLEEWNTSDDMDKALYNFALNRINEQPTADVVEVVRCKDCEYSEESDAVYGIVDYKCSKLNTTCLSPNDFCSYGKKVE